MSKRSVQAQMEEFFYAELLKYLKLAEEKRRWNVFKDIPWERANPDSEDTLAHCVETFCAVEMYLPDFTAKLLHMIRASRGRSWFHVNWGYEESKHSLALEAWLLASGHRTEEQRDEFQNQLLNFEWELPFDHPRQMVCYTMIQELATFHNYRRLEKIAARNHDLALVTALRLISVDERVHYNFYRNTVKEWMKHDEPGTVEDLKYVFDNFTMPGRTQIPNYDESAIILAKTGIYGPREYIRLVKNPILEDLKLDKDFHKMEARDAQDKAKKAAEQEASQREQIALGNGHAIPKRTAPRNPEDENSGDPSRGGGGETGGGSACGGSGRGNGSSGGGANGGTGAGGGAGANGSAGPGASSGPKTPLNSHALSGVLSNLKGEPLQAERAGEDEPKRSPLLELIGVDPKDRPPGSSIIMAWESEAEKLPGSRGMENNKLSQTLIVEGDEKSNNASEMREERAEIKRTRVKNQRLFRKYDGEDKGKD